MSLPRRRATPRRTAHPIQPSWLEHPAEPQPEPDRPGLRRRRQPKRSPEATARRTARAEQRADAWWAFENAVRAATPGGYGDCVGTPWCPTPGPHRGATAHHVLQRSVGGTDDPSNGVWVCQPGHRGIHDHIAAAELLRLLKRSSG